MSRKKLHDPYAEREAQNYENPVPSREYLIDYLEESIGPLTHEELCRDLGIRDDDSIEAMRRRLQAMERDGQLVRNRRGGYGTLARLNVIKGRVQGHPEGFGFVIPEDDGDDVFLSSRQMRRVLDGDIVLVRIAGIDQRGRAEGSIVDVVSHNTQSIVGRYYRESGIHYVRPDNPRITQDVIIGAEEVNGAQPGQIVVVELTAQPSRHSLPAGRISEVLGDQMDPGLEIEVAIRNYGIPHVWPKAVQDETDKLPDEVLEKEKQHRIDLRDLPLVTIDGEDARDFDDAVYCQPKRSGGWTLYVAIADVSHYVQVGSALDEEAWQRGTSVYFPDHVVPMLPEKISNGLCSLKPEVDRLCMVCEMQISADGEVTKFQFFEGLMHSHARLTYTQVAAILADRSRDNGQRKQFAKVVPHLDALHDLYTVLRKRRDQRGAIDFETTETQMLFGPDRKIQQIIPRERTDAHKLIEECMLAANVCAATLLEKTEIPALYRVHQGPPEEKLANLREFLGELGIGLKGGDDPQPADYQEVLAWVADRPDAHVIQSVMLRSMSQAVYQADNDGHFGLAFDAYAHFTSPIRRYPDLLVHRAIRSLLRSKKRVAHLKRVATAPLLPANNIYPYDLIKIDKAGDHCSMAERRADDATRDVSNWLKCEFLQDRIGEKFDGVVSGVTGFGLFVMLDNLAIDGLIHVTSLPRDYYYHEPAQHRLIGEKTRRVFRLGDKVRVELIRVNLDERKIDFELADTTAKRGKLVVTERAKELADEYFDDQQKRPKNKQPDGEGRPPKRKPGSKPKSRSGRSRKRNTGGEAPSRNTPAGKKSASNKSGPRRSRTKTAAGKKGGSGGKGSSKGRRR